MLLLAAIGCPAVPAALLEPLVRPLESCVISVSNRRIVAQLLLLPPMLSKNTFRHGARSVRHALGKLVGLSTAGLPTGPHVIRYQMYRRLAEVGRNLRSRTGDVLAISHSGHLNDIMGITPTRTVEANYPHANILSLPHDDNSFDFIVADQVLEHVEGDPQVALNECHRVLRPGGVVVHTTCFITPIHASPSDFWRFTPEGLRLLARPFSSIVEAAGWGNPYVWAFAGLGLVRHGIPHVEWHPLHWLATHNHPEWPICTWLVAEK